ncbi:unnamed protein product [Closterium sp. Yama58-4]|nr:unnamed protein product [Closterium sp. Yama58-4]
MKIDWNERIAAKTGEKLGAEAAAAPATGSAAEKKEGEMLIALIEEGFALAGSFNLADYVPWLDYGGDPLGMYTRAKRLTPQLHGFMRACIEERRQLAVKGEKPSESTLVDALLEMEGDGEDEINKTELLMLALDMMLAGTDSTAKTVEWTLAELVRNPDVLERLRAEVDAAYAKAASAAAKTEAAGGESCVTVSLPVQEMPYLQAVLKEQFRHHPVTPLFFPRLTTGSVTLGGYNIPPNTMININYWAIGHDPTVWVNPHKFDPSRFLDPAAPDILGQHFSLLPFGSGRRGCLGKTLEIDMSARLLANLVRRFDFELPEEARTAGGVDMTETLGLSMALVKPLRLVMRERKAVGGAVVAGADA